MLMGEAMAVIWAALAPIWGPEVAAAATAWVLSRRAACA